MEDKKLELTKAVYFKNKRMEHNKVELVEMPSKVVFEIRRPDLVKMVKNGLIPADIAVDIQVEAEKENPKLNGRQFQEYCKMLDAVAIASIVTPEVRNGEVTDSDYDNGIISVDDIDQDDKAFIFNYVNTGVKDLKPFRKEE